MRIPKAVVVATACLIGPNAAGAAKLPPVEDYLAAKSAAQAKLKKAAAAGNAEKVAAQEKVLQTALEKRLRRLVSIDAPNGFAGTSSMSPASLSPGEIGSDGPDGIVFESTGGQGRVLATTLDLLRPWLERRHAEKDNGGLPPEPEAALQSETFYTMAVSPDASVNDFAPLNVKPPPGGATARAELVLVTQDTIAYPPADMTAAMIKSGTVLIAIVPAKPKPQPIAACQTILDGMKRKADAALQRYNASNQADTKSFDLSTKLEAQGAEAFRQCWMKEAPRQPGFATLVKRAQSLVDTLAAGVPLGE